MREKLSMIKGLMILFVFMGVFSYSNAAFSDTIEIVAEDDWYPYSAKGDDGPVGIAVDIVRAAYKAAGTEVNFKVMNYDKGMFEVKQGKAIGCFDAPRTEENENDYLWHNEKMFSAENHYYAQSSYKGMVNDVKDVEGKSLGLVQGYGYGNVIDTNDKIDKQYSKSDEVILKKLAAGRLDFVIVFSKVADSLISKMGIQDKVKDVGIADTADIYIAFSKNHPEAGKARDIFNTGFEKIKSNGTLEQIINEWDRKLKGN